MGGRSGPVCGRMTEKGFRVVSEVNNQGWEDTNFPSICETCLGDNPYVRMLKEKYGKECKICTRPFTVFKYKPGSKARYKTTIICNQSGTSDPITKFETACLS